MQPIINLLYRNPRSQLKKFKRFGGYLNYRSMMRSRRQMEKRAAELPPVTSSPDGLPVYFLTGKNYLYQTLYCIQSLNKTTPAGLQFILVDDGSFDAPLAGQVDRQLPGSRIVTASEIDKNLELALPATRYPNLRKKRTIYPHLKKLTDIHTLPGDPWKLVLDSDMLFWDEPSALLNWLKDPKQPLHMVDCVEAYGYSRELMEKLAGTTIKPLINVGAIGLESKGIDWDNLEHWVKTLEAEEGTSYYLEQAITAMLIGDTAALVLDEARYKVNPDKNAVTHHNGILHHYVDLSKEYYFTQAWRHF